MRSLYICDKCNTPDDRLPTCRCSHDSRSIAASAWQTFLRQRWTAAVRRRQRWVFGWNVILSCYPSYYTRHVQLMCKQLKSFSHLHKKFLLFVVLIREETCETRNWVDDVITAQKWEKIMGNKHVSPVPSLHNNFAPYFISLLDIFYIQIHRTTTGLKSTKLRWQKKCDAFEETNKTKEKIKPRNIILLFASKIVFSRHEFPNGFSTFLSFCQSTQRCVLRTNNCVSFNYDTKTIYVFSLWIDEIQFVCLFKMASWNQFKQIHSNVSAYPLSFYLQ